MNFLSSNVLIKLYCLQVDYAKQYGLGGVLVWGVETDDFNGICKEGPYPLLNTVKENLN
jgi:chitinase